MTKYLVKREFSWTRQIEIEAENDEALCEQLDSYNWELAEETQYSVTDIWDEVE